MEASEKQSGEAAFDVHEDFDATLHLHDVPQELLVSILHDATAKSVACFSCTSHAFRTAAQSSIVWRSLCERDWGMHGARLKQTVAPEHASVTWLNVYRACAVACQGFAVRFTKRHIEDQRIPDYCGDIDSRVILLQFYPRLLPAEQQDFDAAMLPLQQICTITAHGCKLRAELKANASATAEELEELRDTCVHRLTMALREINKSSNEHADNGTECRSLQLTLSPALQCTDEVHEFLMFPPENALARASKLNNCWSTSRGHGRDQEVAVALTDGHHRCPTHAVLLGIGAIDPPNFGFTNPCAELLAFGSCRRAEIVETRADPCYRADAPLHEDERRSERTARLVAALLADEGEVASQRVAAQGEPLAGIRFPPPPACGALRVTQPVRPRVVRYMRFLLRTSYDENGQGHAESNVDISKLQAYGVPVPYLDRVLLHDAHDLHDAHEDAPDIEPSLHDGAATAIALPSEQSCLDPRLDPGLRPIDTERGDVPKRDQFASAAAYLDRRRAVFLGPPA